MQKSAVYNWVTGGGAEVEVSVCGGAWGIRTIGGGVSVEGRESMIALLEDILATVKAHTVWEPAAPAPSPEEVEEVVRHAAGSSEAPAGQVFYAVSVACSHYSVSVERSAKGYAVTFSSQYGKVFDCRAEEVALEVSSYGVRVHGPLDNGLHISRSDSARLHGVLDTIKAGNGHTLPLVEAK